MRIALLGFGTVGQAVARLLANHPTLTLTHVFNRDVERKRADWVPASTIWTESIDEVIAARPDIVVELIGGRVPAAEMIRRALDAGCHVVTANKQVIAHDGHHLLARAAARNRCLGYEGAVLGGVPVVRGIREGLAGDRLSTVMGVLNGTCNFILTRMEQDGVEFDEALREAQRLGFAEADPADDLDGADAAAKLAILARLALRREIAPASIACASIRPLRRVDFQYARRLDCTIRQVSLAQIDPERDAVTVFVRPALVPVSSPLARVVRNQNIVVTTGAAGGEVTFSGLGAGGAPTAVAVLSDILAIARGEAAPPDQSTSRVPSTVGSRLHTPFYLRLVVQDRPGIVAAVSTALAAHQLDIQAVLQEPGADKSALPFVITLEPCDPEELAGALHRIVHLDFHRQPPLAMPMLA